jgi:hypothetical protein
MKIRVRVGSGSTVSQMGMYAGFIGRDLDDEAYVSRTGGTDWNVANFFCMRVADHAKDDQWVEYVGYLQGSSATEDDAAHPLASTPGTLHTNAKWFRPVVIVNSNNGAGVVLVDQIVVEKIPAKADSQWAYDNDTTYIDGGNIYTGTLNASKITAGTITTDRLIGGAITTQGSSVQGSEQKIPDLGNLYPVEVTFTTIGGPVAIFAQLRLRGTEDGASADIYLRQDTTDIYTPGNFESWPEYTDESVTIKAHSPIIPIVYRHTPAAGEYTWSIKCSSPGTEDIYVNSAVLIVMELKR